MTDIANNILAEISASDRTVVENTTSLKDFLFGDGSTSLANALGELPRIFADEGDDLRDKFITQLTDTFVPAMGSEIANSQTNIKILSTLESIRESLKGPSDLEQSDANRVRGNAPDGDGGSGPNVQTDLGKASGGIGGFLTKIAQGVAAFGDKKAVAGSTTLIKIAGAFGILTASLVAMSYVEWTSIVKGIAVMGGLILTAKTVSKLGKKGPQGLMALAGALAITAGALIVFGYVTWESVGKGIVTLGALSLAAFAIGKAGPIGPLALLALGGALLMSAVAFQMFGEVSWTAVAVGTVVLGVLAVAVAALGAAAPTILPGALAILAISGALLVSALAFQMFGDVSWAAVGIGTVALGVLAAAVAGLGFVAPFILAGSVALGAMGAALLVAAIGFAAFSLVPFAKLGAGLLTTIKMVGVFTLAGVASIAIVLGAVAMAAMSTALIAAAVGFGLFSLINWKSLEAGYKPFTEMIKTMAMAGLVSPLIVLGAAAMVTMSIGMVAFSVGAWALSKIDWRNLEPVGDVIKDLSSSLAHVTEEDGNVFGSGFLAVMGAGLAAFALEMIPLQFIKWDALDAVPSVIKGLSGALAGVTEEDGNVWGSGFLTLMGEGLNSFGVNIQGFGNLNWEGMKVAPTVIRELSTVLSFVNDQDGNTKGAGWLAMMGEGLNSFGVNIQGFGNLNWERMRVAPATIRSLSTVLAFVNDQAGNAMGAASLIAMGIGLNAFRASIQGFGDLDWESMRVAPPVIKALSGVLSFVNEQDGNTKGSAWLAVMGAGLNSFGNNVRVLGFINWKAMQSAPAAIRSISSACAFVDELDDPDDGADTLGKMALGLGMFGQAANILGKTNWAQLTTAPQMIIRLSNTMAEIADTKNNVAGARDIAHIGASLGIAAPGLNALGRINWEGVDLAGVVLPTFMNSMASISTKIEDINIFGLFGLSIALMPFAAALERIGNANISTTMPHLKEFGEFINVLSHANVDNLYYVIEALNDLDFPSIEVRHTIDAMMHTDNSNEDTNNLIITLIELIRSNNNLLSGVNSELTEIKAIEQQHTEISKNKKFNTTIDASNDYPGLGSMASKSYY